MALAAWQAIRALIKTKLPHNFPGPLHEQQAYRRRIRPALGHASVASLSERRKPAQQAALSSALENSPAVGVVVDLRWGRRMAVVKPAEAQSLFQEYAGLDPKTSSG